MTPFHTASDHITPDATIDRVLQGFRDTEAPSGLEARILHNLNNLQQRNQLTSAPPPTTLWTRLDPSRWPLTFRIPAMAIPATAILVLLLALTHKYAITPTQPTSIATHHDAVTPIPLVVPAATNQPHHSTFVAQLPQVTHTVPVDFIPQSQAAAPLSPEDQLALEESHAPSQPAPPMLLTAEERLLVRSTRQGAPIEVAELDQLREPMLRAAAAARERANLERYATGLIAPLLTFQNLIPSTAPENTPPAPEPSTDLTSEPQTSSK
jgi:hypothetical protein